MKIDVMDLEKRLRENEATSIRDYTEGRADAPVIYKSTGYALPKAPQSSTDMQSPQVFVASEESEDRMGDVIRVGGWNLKQFKRNPVFMFQHNYNIPPIGIVPKVWVDGRQLLNTVQWDDESPLGAEIHGKFERRIMRAESVGFRALNVQERNSKGMAGSFEFLEQELLEISAVSIPAHPAALRKALDEMGNPNQVYILGEIPVGNLARKGEEYSLMLASTPLLEKEHREDLAEEAVSEEAVEEIAVEETAAEEAEESEDEATPGEEAEDGDGEEVAPEAMSKGLETDTIVRVLSKADMSSLAEAKKVLESLLTDEPIAEAKEDRTLDLEVDGKITDDQMKRLREAITGIYSK